jgi:hypothetical protein
MDMHAYFSRRLGQCRPRTHGEIRVITIRIRSCYELYNSYLFAKERNGNIRRTLYVRWNPILSVGGWAVCR